MNTIEISLTKTLHKAIIDPEDFDIINARKWYFDEGHPYTKVMVPIDDPDAHHKSFPLKIRMDRYILGLTTHNFINIRHWAGDRLNNQRRWFFQEPKSKAKKTKGMTRYLGVTIETGFIVAKYEDKKNNIHKVERYPIKRSAPQYERLGLEQTAAHLYDEWVMMYEDPWEAKTNFLPKSIYPLL